MYDIVIKDLYRAFLTQDAADKQLSHRDYLRSSIEAVGPPKADMYAAAIVTCKVNACDLCTRSLAGDKTMSQAYLLSVLSARGARNRRPHGALRGARILQPSVD